LLDRETQDVRAAETIALFCYQVKKWIGVFAASTKNIKKNRNDCRASRWPATNGCCGPVAATSNDTAASAHGLDSPRVGWSQRNERGFMMNHDGWMGGGMWIWTVIGILVVVLLVVVINKLSNK
jgi:hypothetical protein